MCCFIVLKLKRSNILTNTNKPHQIEWMRFHFLMPVCISLKVTFRGKRNVFLLFIWIKCAQHVFASVFTTPFSGMLKSCPFYNILQRSKIYIYVIFIFIYFHLKFCYEEIIEIEIGKEYIICIGRKLQFHYQLFIITCHSSKSKYLWYLQKVIEL